MSRRVVVTGLGIVSCLGNDAATVTSALREGRSGITVQQQHVDMGMRSHIGGRPAINPAELIDRKQLRFMGDAAATLTATERAFVRSMAGGGFLQEFFDPAGAQLIERERRHGIGRVHRAAVGSSRVCRCCHTFSNNRGCAAAVGWMPSGCIMPGCAATPSSRNGTSPTPNLSASSR